MPTQFPMPCRFDPAHGTFPNPPTLSDHYREMHANEWTPKPKRATPPPPSTVHERVVCAACGLNVGYNNLRRHVRAAHPSIGERPTHELISSKAAVPTAIAVAKPELSPVPPTPLGPDDVDGIVSFVVEQLAEPSGLIPVAHLGAIFVWREQTAAFLRAVAGSPPAP